MAKQFVGVSVRQFLVLLAFLSGSIGQSLEQTAITSNVTTNSGDATNPNNATITVQEPQELKDNIPPLEFPDDETVLRGNKTLIEALEASSTTNQTDRQTDKQIEKQTNKTKQQNEKTSQANAELEDFNEVPQEEPFVTERPMTHEELARMIFTNDTFMRSWDERKEDAELIQDKASFEAVVALRDEEQSNDGLPSLATAGHLTVAVAAVFVLFCVSSYVGLMLWRRYLERQYGNREMLVNEEFYEPNDMKHFSI